MSQHPNVLLLLTLTPDDLARKTYRAILEECKIQDEGECTDEIKIDGEGYSHYVAEEGYNDSWQVSAPEGSIVLLNLVTYGYGEQIAWDELVKQKQALQSWADVICARYKCSARISVSANYW